MMPNRQPLRDITNSVVVPRRLWLVSIARAMEDVLAGDTDDADILERFLELLYLLVHATESSLLPENLLHTRRMYAGMSSPLGAFVFGTRGNVLVDTLVLTTRQLNAAQRLVQIWNEAV